MPLVSFKPTKARLVIENDKDSVLVMKVAVAKGETVELASGGRLESLSGVLRIRERAANGTRVNGAIGSLIYIDESGHGPNFAPAKFQINLGMAADKFEPLLRVALSGRLPNKFFVTAGERVSARETRGLSYGLRSDVRTKVWDTASFRTLPVTNFAMILPIEVPEVLCHHRPDVRIQRGRGHALVFAPLRRDVDGAGYEHVGCQVADHLLHAQFVPRMLE